LSLYMKEWEEEKEEEEEEGSVVVSCMNNG
jgi:hypothetical protein